MKVVLAGFNIEAEMIAEAGKLVGRELTPEVISAAYARISRDPRSVGTLRREARREVEKARKSNETIIFGLGHSSVAEHASFNFDVMNVSRLAVESIEHFRIASFTEKSQRYIRLGRDHVIPAEVRKIGRTREFTRLVHGLAGAYETVHAKMLDSGEDKWTAREDARYLMPLATSAQFGMTVNARELEYMISRLASHRLEELRSFSARLSKIARKIAPSLVKYPEATRYFESIDSVREEAGRGAGCEAEGAGRSVKLLDCTPDADARLAAALIFSGSGSSYGAALRKARKLGKKKARKLILSTMREIESHDSVMREFENIDFLFELIASASCYAQLKRHRMSTQTVQRYSTSLGISIPDSVRASGCSDIFMDAIGHSERVYRTLKNKAGDSAAEYALTNAHRRRVLLKINLRELYHFSRLRSDIHAQWEIRKLSGEMCRLAMKRMPAGAALLSGKNNFEERKRKTLSDETP